MYNFQNELQMLDVDDFQVSEPVTWGYHPYDMEQEQQRQFGLIFSCFSCFACYSCFNCYNCFNCFRCSNCFRCGRCGGGYRCGGRCGGR